MTSLRMDVASADGTHFIATVVGRGRPIVIVHPGGGSSSSWRRVAELLAADFRVFRFDRRPYRIPGAVGRRATIADEVSDVAAIVAEVGERVLLVGHSSGAVIALEAAIVSRARFAGLVLYEPPVAVTTPLGRGARARESGA
jgi:pimeloyl-ACP methyl ester carboxylesterase